jgi:hypothetical protein
VDMANQVGEPWSKSGWVTTKSLGPTRIMDPEQALRRGVIGTLPPRNPTVGRYVVEIRDAAGASLLLTSADWTAKERDLAISAVLRLVGMKARAMANAQD